MARPGEVLNECISIMDGKLVLFPELLNQANSHSVVQIFSFLNLINRWVFCSIRGMVAMQSLRTASIYSFPLSTIKTLLAIIVAVKCLY